MSAAATQAGATLNRTVDWHSINWKKVYRTVRRLQARIVKAVREGKWHKVKALVYLLTHSFCGRAMAVLRVVSNNGAKTPGVDGVLWKTPEAKSAAFSELRRRGYQPQPLRRMYIPKKNGKRRPLGIPVMRCRGMQALYLQGLDPIEETLADGHSYAFRLERCCQDAVDQCHKILRRQRGVNGPDVVLEGDITSCYDRIDHGWLLDHIPMDREVLGKWLKAGYLENQAFFATTEGTPQGGIISPALANRTLDELQGLLAERFDVPRSRQQQSRINLVRYADDFIITGTSQILLEYEVKPLVVQFLKERGLELSHEKTRITHVEDGFDFLGQTIRRHANGKIIIKPSKANVKTFLAKIRETIDNSGGMTAGDMIFRLNQQIKGWTMYHRFVVSGRTFAAVDHRIFWCLMRWCRKRHPKKNWEWIKKKYFQRVGNDNWVFHGVIRNSKGKGIPIQLMKAARVKLYRWKKIRMDVNPYDPVWELYLEERECWKWTHTLAKRSRIDYLWKEQEGKCTVCGQRLRFEEMPWHVHHRIWLCRGGEDTFDNMELLHANCHRQIHAREGY